MNEAKYRDSEARLWESVALKPEERFVSLPTSGARVRVQEVGEGPPVLFVHGGPDSGSTWAPMLEHFEGFRCLLLDRPGTGLSQPVRLQRSEIVSFASTLVGDTLDALEIDRSHVVASSLGGYCALWSASRVPERLDRMVQMACPALLPNQQIPSFMKAIMLPGLRKVIALLPPTKRSEEWIMRQIGHGASIDAGTLPEAHQAWYAALQRYTNTMRNDFDLIHLIGRDFLDNPEDELVLGADTLAKVPTPTHFIWGLDDPFGGREVGEWIVAAMPHASSYFIEDSGHLPWLDDPLRVGQAAMSFLSDTT